MLFIPFFVAFLVTGIQCTNTYSYSTKSLCKTLLGTKSVKPVKTSSYALTYPYTYTKKVTNSPTSTVTPPPVRTTITVTVTGTTVVVTTAATPVVTSTATETKTSFSTTTLTETTETTTIPPASVVPTPAGFTPIVSAGGYVPKKRSAVDAPAPAALAIRGRQIQERPAGKHLDRRTWQNPGSNLYPTSVVCGALVAAITTTTKTFSATRTATTTLKPATQSITTATTATTVTSTETVQGPVPTEYAQCQSNNMISSANGGNAITVVQANNLQIDFYPSNGDPNTDDWNTADPNTDDWNTDDPNTADPNPADPTSCCVRCAQTPNCTGFQMDPGNNCFVYSIPEGRGTCGSYQVEQTYRTFPDPNPVFTIGNGQCGQFQNGGNS
ncbi:MAG: hypothetical protein Q9174_001019 [Haloplaca sp. 1 TL-2023]